MQTRNPICVVFVLLLACTGMARGQQVAEYRGTLEPRLVANVPPWGVLSRLRAATDEERGRVKIALAAADRVSVAEVAPLAKGLKLGAVLVERPNGRLAVLVDLNGDGTWTASEGASLAPSEDPQDPPGSVVGTFEVPLPAGYAYTSYPLLMMVSRMEWSGQPNPRTMLLQSNGVAAQGTVDIDGRRTLVRYTSVSLRTGAIDPNAGWVGVDCDGDGTIDTSEDSREDSRADGRPVVFRAESRYVSTASVDPTTRTIVMRAHPASDYDRIERRLGLQVPGFSFIDFEGKPRSLSEFRGKYLLLDFWGSWCGPCISRFPALKDVYAKYHGRGFDILGMDKEDWEGDQVTPVFEKAKAVIAEKGVPWPQASPDSIKSVIARFHIIGYPSYVLLDPEGKIVSWGGKGQLPLDGPELATTLEKLLKK